MEKIRNTVEYLLLLNHGKLVILALAVAIVLITASIVVSTYKMIENQKLKEVYVDIRARASGFKKVKSKEDEKHKEEYSKIEKYLKKKGFTYYFGGKLTPATYKNLKIIIGLAVALVLGLFFKIIGLVLGFLIGYNLVDYYIERVDKLENDEILKDIGIMLSAIQMQNTTGIYITRNIQECISIVDNERLRKALVELNGQINSKVPLEEALNDFKSKFDNKYIDTLGTSISQISKTGAASSMLESITREMIDVLNVINLRTKERMNERVQIAMILGYVVVIAMVALNAIYGLGVDDINSLIGF